jgi:molecular chaperone DnaJ
MTGQDWFDKDFYAILGVPKNADDVAIKKAYRKLARKLHPDHNPGDNVAETRFKEVGEAYSVLSDPEQRQQYDAVRAMAGGGARFSAPGAGSGGAGGPGFEDVFSGMFGAGGPGGGGRVRYSTSGADSADFDDILSGMFGGGAGRGAAGFGRRAQRGTDLDATTTLPFRQAVEGSTVTLTVDGRKVTARIPPGVRDGQRIRLRGKGRPGTGGGPAGDLAIKISVEPHPVFSLHGRDLRVTLPVTFAEAAMGAEVEVPTLDGSTVKVRVPAGTPSGRTLRVRGKGVPAQGSAGKPPGDLLVVVQVVVPQRLTDEARAAVEAFAQATGDTDVRAELRERAGR